VVGERARHVRHLHVADIVVAQHLFGHLGSRQIAREPYLRVFGEYRLQTGLHYVARHRYGDHQQYRSRRRYARREAVFGAVIILRQLQEL
jgi:hypothetical protein